MLLFTLRYEAVKSRANQWLETKKAHDRFCDRGLLNDSVFLTTCLRQSSLLHPQKPTAATRMAALRGQKPRLRHDRRNNSPRKTGLARHEIHFQAMDSFEVQHFFSVRCLRKKCNRFQDFVKWRCGEKHPNTTVSNAGCIRDGLIRADAALKFTPGEEFTGALRRRAGGIAMANDILIGDMIERF